MPVTDEMVNDLVVQVLEIRPRVALLVQYAKRMGRECHQKTLAGGFVNWDRLDIYISFSRIADEQNPYIRQLMMGIFEGELRGTR